MKALKLLVALGAISAGLTWSGVSTAQDNLKGTTLTVASYGGPWDATQQEMIADKLRDQYGISVKYVPGVAIQHIAKAALTKQNPEFDLMYIDSPNMTRAIDAGVIDKVTVNDVPGLEDVYPQAREFGDYGVPITFGSIGIAYNTEKIEVPPVTYSDLGNSEYKGKVALFDLTNDARVISLIAIAQEQGGSVDNVDPAFKFLDKIKGNLLTVTPSSGTMAQLLQQQEAFVGPHYSPRIMLMKQQGVPLELVTPEDARYVTIGYINLVSNSKQRAAALKYLELAISEPAQRAMAEKNFYGPTNRTLELTPEVQEKLPIYGEDSVKSIRPVDWRIVAENRPAWIERWNKTLAGQ